MKNVLVLLLLILIGCKTTFRANTNDTFRYETAYITQSSPIHRTDSTGYFNFDFITNEDIALRFGFRCRETIKPQLGKHLNVIIYLNNDYMRQQTLRNENDK